MKIVERLTVILFAAVLAVFVATRIYLRRISDKTPPTISCQSGVMDISVNTRERQLLKGVTAWDDRDGDLTDRVMIQGITPLLEGNTAKVTYIVFDAANNMATCQRTVRYTDYEGPRFYLKEPLIYPVGAEIDLTDRLGAVDAAGTDISDNIRVTAQNVSINDEGAYRITVQVTNDMGDAASLSLPLMIDNKAARQPKLTLSDYIVYLDRDSTFRGIKYVTAAEGLEGEDYFRYYVKLGGEVDTGTPGVYEVTYTHQSYTVTQTVIVK